MKTPGNDVSEISIHHPVNEHSYANEPKAPLLLPNKMEYRPETNLNHHWKILVNNNLKKTKPKLFQCHVKLARPDQLMSLNMQMSS